MTTIDTLLARTSPLSGCEAILLASEGEVLLQRAKLCFAAAAVNTRLKQTEMDDMNFAVLAALDNMPSIPNWEEAEAISGLTGE